MINYLIVTFISFALLLVTKFIWESFGSFDSKKKKPRSVLDQLNADPKVKEMKELLEAMRNLNKDATDQDMIPGGKPVSSVMKRPTRYL
jgi:hypothetical protein